MSKPVYTLGGFALDAQTRVLRRGDETVPLPRKALDTLIFLVENRARVVEKPELMRHLWPDRIVDEANLTQQIFTLRRALGDAPEGNLYIRTVPRHGYRFVGEVEVVVAPPARETTPEGSQPARAWRALPLLLLVGVVLLGAAAVLMLSRHRAGPPPDRVMLAVLPFVNESGGNDDDYLADGVTEELIGVLSRLSPARLGVIARASVAPYRTTRKPLPEVARELGVHFFLGGSVRQAAGSLRIVALLSDTTTGRTSWKTTYERPVSEVFRVEAEIAEAVASRIGVPPAPGVLSVPAPPSPEAHMAYLKGLYFWNKRNEAGLRRAIELFREALHLEPDYARAQAGLATSYARLATSADALEASEARAFAEAGAKRALALDPLVPEGHAALAIVRCQFDWSWAECERELTRTLALDPSYSSGRQWLGEFLVQRGRFEAGQEELRKARALDPISPSIHTNLGIACMYGRRYEEALAAFAQALELDPDFLLAHRARGLTLTRCGRVDAGLESLRKARRIDPGSARAAADLGYALARAGRIEEARAVLKEIEALSGQRPVSAYDFAVVHAGLGETEAALRSLEKGYGDRATGMRWLKVEPIFDPLRGEPRFRHLLAKIAIPD